MRISYIQNKTELQSTETRISYNLIQNILGRGHEIVLNDCDDSCDVILSMNGLSQSHLFNKISSAYPNIKTVMYVWDCYPWTEYFKGYTELNSYTEIWTPSNEVILRLKEAYGVDESKCRVIKAYTTFFDSEPNKIRNDKFVYHFARP